MNEALTHIAILSAKPNSAKQRETAVMYLIAGWQSDHARDQDYPNRCCRVEAGYNGCRFRSQEENSDPSDSVVTRTTRLSVPVILLAQFAFFAFVALHRFIDADEGSYLLASRLVLLNKKPYLDFFYNQAPLLPYVYGAWLKLTGTSWISAKIFSAALTSLVGTLLYVDVWRRTQRMLAGTAAAILFVSSTLVFAWFPLVKTYSLSGLFLFSAYVLTGCVSKVSAPWRAACGGLLFGLSVDTRSYLILVLPVFLWWILQNSDTTSKKASSLWFLLGLAIALVPSGLLFLSSPDRFLFDNLTYHSMRSSGGLIGWWLEKFVIALQLFLGGGEANGLQWSILFFVSLGLLVAFAERPQSPRFALQIAIALSLICLLPTPAYLQYFCLCVPFLIVSAVCLVTEFYRSIESSRERRWVASACAILILVYLAASASDFRRYLITGNDVPGAKAAPDRGDWTLPRVLKVSAAIDGIAGSGEVVASFWPGDIFQTEAEPFPGFENPFGMPVAAKLTDDQRVRYHIVSSSQVKADFAACRPRVVVLRDQIISPASAEAHGSIWQRGDEFRNVLVAHGYQRVRSIGGISIYVCASAP